MSTTSPTAARPAKHGTGHFIAERVTAIALLILTPWFVLSAAFILTGGYDAARTWMAAPLNAAGVGLFVLISLYHMRLGLQVVIEDYIHKAGTRSLLLALNTLVVLAAAAVAVWAIYAISFGG